MRSHSVLLACVLLLTGCLSTTVSDTQQTSSVAVSSAASEQTRSSVPAPNVTLKAYKNARLGFSMQIPTHVLVEQGDCVPATGGFKPQEAFIPVVTLDDDNRVYITNEYEYIFPDSARRDGYYALDRCSKQTTTAATVREQIDTYKIRKPFYTWVIERHTVRDPAALDALIKQRYGKDCTIGNRTETNQPGVVDVEVGGFTAPDSDKDCFVNYGTVIRYSPERQTVFVWDLGQEATFTAGGNFGAPAFDERMVQSFRFEK